jgi:hypothetical protein
MNSTILAERQAKAIQAIAEHADRLGGHFAQPTARASSPAAKYVLILEAIAQALAEIRHDAPPPELPTAMPEPLPPQRRKGGL